MDNQEIRTLRLANQQISSTNFKKPEELVQYLGAMQAQEYAMQNGRLDCASQI
ncbi:hypothetical protein AB6883_15070 [Carnobacterium maltaromaticum]|uniref:hypothetical protein n=1 Tax=Carnobacterium maltaromaticum TaxID=2751 RepID=UPI00116A4BF0|nr:hypothetical protein [Carnobacterium maltaromaticum]MDT1946261.1 hypothetical protein [Carnobacterium maltaromaticum]MDT1999838.1 hypothetical protein [Carnobacterium maltaromaticum]GED49951.1 hypothetical protein CMA01_23610 [Carnobacterium maltaromaticum]